MFEVMNSPTDLGNKEKMAAAKDVLDRSGFIKTEKVEVSAANPLFILPRKLMKTNKTWKLPKPVEIGGEYEWRPVVRVGTHVPFGYSKIPMIKIYCYQSQKN